MKMREDFENWLFIMDDVLDEFIESFQNPINEELDFSIESLDVLETWMLKNFNSHQELMDERNKEIHDQISRYIGETFRKSLNAKWNIRYDDPKFAFYGLPIIVEKDSNNTIACPHTLSTTTIARRQEDFLRKILSNNLKKLNK